MPQHRRRLPQSRGQQDARLSYASLSTMTLWPNPADMLISPAKRQTLVNGAYPI
jgi:hypothetical protein